MQICRERVMQSIYWPTETWIMSYCLFSISCNAYFVIEVYIKTNTFYVCMLIVTYFSSSPVLIERTFPSTTEIAPRVAAITKSLEIYKRATVTRIRESFTPIENGFQQLIHWEFLVSPLLHQGVVGSLSAPWSLNITLNMALSRRSRCCNVPLGNSLADCSSSFQSLNYKMNTATGLSVWLVSRS